MAASDVVETGVREISKITVPEHDYPVFYLLARVGRFVESDFYIARICVDIEVLFSDSSEPELVMPLRIRFHPHVPALVYTGMYVQVPLGLTLLHGHQVKGYSTLPTGKVKPSVNGSSGHIILDGLDFDDHTRVIRMTVRDGCNLVPIPTTLGL